MKKFVLATFLLLLCKVCFSQNNFKPGYIITQSGDSIAGFVNNRGGGRSYHSCAFRESLDQATRMYKPDELAAFGFLDGERFQSRTITLADSVEHTVFLEALVHGRVSLYKYDQYYWAEKNATLYVLLNELREVYVNNTKYVKHTNRHIGTLGALMGDCVEILSAIQKVKLSERDLSELVENYNRCVGSVPIIYKEKKPWIKPEVGIVAGMMISQINFTTNMGNFHHLTGSFESSKSAAFGLSLDILVPRLVERVSFYSEILYTGTVYYHYDVEPSQFSTERNYLTINLKQLKIPLGIRYTFPEKKLTPMITAGISGTMHVKQNSTWIQERESPTTVQTYSGMALTEIKSSQFGFWGSLGVQLPINDKLNASLEFRYERTNGIVPFTVDSGDLTSSISNFQILAGIRFK